MRDPVPNFRNDVPKESKDANHDEDAKEFPPVLGTHFGFNVLHGLQFRRVVMGGGNIWWEAARGFIGFHHGILLVPPFSKPDVELVVVVQWDVVDAETAPVKVDGLGRPTLEVGA